MKPTKEWFAGMPIMLLIITMAFPHFKDELGQLGIIYFGIGCFLTYTSAIVSFILVLTPGGEIFGDYTEEISAVFLAVVWPALIILLFAYGWGAFDDQFASQLSAQFSDLNPSVIANRIYISAVTFTSTGYGDFVPKGWTGRWYAVIEAFLGHIHAAVFFSMLFSRVDRWRKSTA